MTTVAAAISLGGSPKALVTGGAGLIGSHITDLLLEQGVEEVVVLDNFSRGQPENLSKALATGSVRLVRGDIRDPALLVRLMDGIDVVFHQAALRITQCAEDPRLAIDVLVDGTFNVLEAAARAGVRKVVEASSASVYGAATEFPTPESHHPYNNRTLYGISKTFNEGLLRCFKETYGLDYVALRYFNVYGPRMDIWGVYTEVLVRWISAIGASQPPVIYGDGTQTMDFIYAGDVARANLLAAASPISDEVFNIASGVETSLNELLAMLLRVMRSNLEPVHAPERAVNPVPRRLADTHKATESLGFRAQVSLEEGLRRLVAWCQATQPERLPAIQQSR
jgi:UDP-glucose 4-epimerase